VFGSFVFDLLRKLSISPVRSHLVMPPGRSPGCTETLDAVGPELVLAGAPPHANTMTMTPRAAMDL
jgi:hypothetical protein